MDSLEFMKAIGLPEYAIAAVGRIPLTEEEIADLPRASFLDEPYRGDRPDRVLALFVKYLAKHSEEAYRKRGVTREEWLDTMRDIAIWCRQLFCGSGEVGLRETHWLAHLVRTEIFRLGRLQFMPRLLSEDLRCGSNNFSAGTRYSEVHIPAEGRLLPELVEASFARAKQLFAPKLFACESWLLSPRLRELLAGGNILDFAARFQVVSVDENDRSAERYIFGKISDPGEYRPANGFSSRVRDRALEGSFVGSAYGICLAENIF